uniref:hypothetical protein n=1 Tax=uncultured Bacteroides sp. TaxID=162156 RepID=UPI00280AAFAE
MGIGFGFIAIRRAARKINSPRISSVLEITPVSSIECLSPGFREQAVEQIPPGCRFFRKIARHAVAHHGKLSLAGKEPPAAAVRRG